MQPRDLVIIGAGCAGLSLAAHLVHAGVTASRRVVLLDPRQDFSDDRTFCFWTTERHLFADTVAHAWPEWSVRVPGETVVRAAPGLAYAHVPGRAFYARALERLRRAGDAVELRLGVRVHGVRDEGSAVAVDTSAGVVRGALAFDGRPAPSVLGRGAHVRLLQHFRGHFVTTEVDAFTPERATLMDFDVDQRHGLHFVYVLPFDARHALVESTFFSERVVGAEVYDEAIRRYLHERLGLEAWRVERTEAGAIPMTTAPFEARVSPRVLRIGLGAGMARASTGYAFAAIQRWSQRMAEWLATHSETAVPPTILPRSRRYTALDATLLSVLRRTPEAGPALFARLFSRVDPATLVRFLSDCSSVADDLRVMRSSPLLTMSLESARAAPLWLRP